MNRKKILSKLLKAVNTDSNYYELVVFGNIDNGGEEKWSSMSLGAMSADQELTVADKHDIKELLSKWRDYIIASFDDDGCGLFLKGRLQLVDFIWGNDATEVARRVGDAASKHWRCMAASAIKAGVDSAIVL